MAKTRTHSDDDFAVNPASQAAAVRAAPLIVVDDELRDRDGNRTAPKNTREEVRANQLGGAAADAATDQRIVSQIAPHRASAAGLQEERDAAEPRRVIAQDMHAALAQACLNAAAIPCSTLAPKLKFFSSATKPGFVLGDTAVMAVVLVRAGAPQWLAILLGLSMALSTVMVGTQLGRVMALAYQRRARGPAPEDCPLGERDLYDDGRADTDLRHWLVLGASTAGALLVAVTLIGVGQGDPAPLAFGFGLLAALTFGGAAGAESYGTNAAAERRHDLEAQRDAAKLELIDFEGLAHRTAYEAELADTLMAAASHGAAAVGATVETIADRAPDNPHVFSYSRPDPQARRNRAAPRDLPAFKTGGPTAPPPRTSTIHRLVDPFRVSQAPRNNDVRASNKVHANKRAATP